MVLLDRLDSYARENISNDDKVVEEWIRSWDIDIALYDINLGFLQEAKEFLSNNGEVPITVKEEELWKGRPEGIPDYINELMLRYLAERKATASVKGQLSYFKLSSFIKDMCNFSFNYINLLDNEQIQRLSNIPHEVAFHQNVDTSNGNLPFEHVKELLAEGFNPEYPGLGSWYETEATFYPPN